LHRAFDMCPDPMAALEVAVRLGFDRILTSGGCVTALEGRTVLAALVRQARGRIRILAGCGIGPENVGSILATGAEEIHSSCQVPRLNNDPKSITLGFDEPDSKHTSAERVAALAAAITQWRSTHA
jgi:copper homeostasis protein